MPDALSATGDISNDGTKITYDRAFKKIKELRLPALCVPGNHDDGKNLIKHLPSEFSDRLLIIKNWILIGLNSAVKSSPEGLLSSGELEKMQHLLQENTSKNVIICLHHQPVKIGSDWIDKIGLKNKKDFFSGWFHCSNHKPPFVIELFKTEEMVRCTSKSLNAIL